MSHRWGGEDAIALLGCAAIGMQSTKESRVIVTGLYKDTGLYEVTGLYECRRGGAGDFLILRLTGLGLSRSVSLYKSVCP